MARSRILSLWAVAACALGLLAATAGQPARPGQPAPHHATPAAVGVLSGAPDAAVLPPRATDELRLSSASTQLRVLVLAAVLALLVALPTVLQRTSTAGRRDQRPLRSRRYAISLRAPPLRFA